MELFLQDFKNGTLKEMMAEKGEWSWNHLSPQTTHPICLRMQLLGLASHSVAMQLH